MSGTEQWERIAEHSRQAFYSTLAPSLASVSNGYESAVLCGALAAISTAWMALRDEGVSADTVANAICATIRDGIAQLEAEEATKQ